MQPQLVDQPRPSTQGRVPRLVGWALVVPAAVMAVLTLVIPTVRTIVLSMRSEELFGDRASSGVGFDNFGRAFDNLRFWPSLWFSLSLVLVPIVIAVILAPLLAAAFAWAGGWARMAVRIVLSLVLVVFSPLAFAIAWQRSFRDDPARLADPALAAGTVRLAVAMMTFGMVCAIGVLLFLPVFRARELRRPMWPALFATAGLIVLGLLAIGLQQFTVPYVLTNFGPSNRTTTPVGVLFDGAFRRLQAGQGAAVATLLLLILAVLGVAAVLIVILTRLRISLRPARKPVAEALVPAPATRRNVLAIVVAALALAAMAVVIVLNTLPWFDSLSGRAPQAPPGTMDRTWSPAIVGALTSVGIAYLAALGISGLRPLGRHSEWLLLPFAPWLFVGLAPLSIEFFRSIRDRGEIDTDTALHPPIMISIISLVLLAMLCRGQSQRWQEEVAAGASPADSFFRTVVFPTLPVAGLLATVITLVTAQDLYWPLIVAISPEHSTTAVNLLRLHSGEPGADFSLATATPVLALVVAFAILTAVQLLHLDRTYASTGSTAEQTTPDSVA